MPVAGWAKVVEAVHAAGSKIFPQIWHMGVMRDAQASGTRRWSPSSPSGLLLPGKSRGRAMTDAEVADSIEDFAEAARNAKAAGFDGVELHGAHGYLIDQFFWEGTNTRTDQYGGDMVARTRYACEIIRAVRAAVGPDYPIMLRYSQWKQQDFESKLAPTPEALEAFLAPLTDAGLDAYHCSTRRYWEPEFEGSAMNLAGWTKKLTGLATVTVGSVGLNQTSSPATPRKTRSAQRTSMAWPSGWKPGSSTWSPWAAPLSRPRTGPGSWLPGSWARQPPTAAPSSLSSSRAPAAASPAEVGDAPWPAHRRKPAEGDGDHPSAAPATVGPRADAPLA